MSNQIAELNSEAHLRILPFGGGLSKDEAAPILAVLRELLSQWRQNQSVRDGAVELLEGGAFVAIAYESSGPDVSGCTKDQLSHTILQFESQLGVPILNAPSLAVELDGDVRVMDREEFRRLRAEGVIGESTVAFDLLVDRVGNLAKFRTTVGESWYDRIGRPKTSQA